MKYNDLPPDNPDDPPLTNGDSMADGLAPAHEADFIIQHVSVEQAMAPSANAGELEGCASDQAAGPAETTELPPEIRHVLRSGSLSIGRVAAPAQSDSAQSSGETPTPPPSVWAPGVILAAQDPLPTAADLTPDQPHVSPHARPVAAQPDLASSGIKPRRLSPEKVAPGATRPDREADFSSKTVDEAMSLLSPISARHPEVTENLKTLFKSLHPQQKPQGDLNSPKQDRQTASDTPSDYATTDQGKPSTTREIVAFPSESGSSAIPSEQPDTPVSPQPAQPTRATQPPQPTQPTRATQPAAATSPSAPPQTWRAQTKESVIALSQTLQLKQAAQKSLQATAGRLFFLAWPATLLVFALYRFWISQQAPVWEIQFLGYGLGSLGLALFALIIPLLYTAKTQTLDPQFLLGERRPSPMAILLTTLLGLPLGLALTGLTHTFAYSWLSLNLPDFHQLWPLGPALLTEQADAWAYAFIFLINGLILPVSEELFFRGLLQGLLTRGGRYKGAWIAQALAYALFVPDPYFWLTSFLLGLFLGYLRLQMKSWWPVIGARLVYSLTVLVFYDLLPGLLQTSLLVGTRSGRTLFQLGLTATIIALVALIPALKLLGTFRPKARRLATAQADEPVSERLVSPLFVIACILFWLTRYFLL